MFCSHAFSITLSGEAWTQNNSFFLHPYLLKILDPQEVILFTPFHVIMRFYLIITKSKVFFPPFGECSATQSWPNAFFLNGSIILSVAKLQRFIYQIYKNQSSWSIDIILFICVFFLQSFNYVLGHCRLCGIHRGGAAPPLCTPT